jgi:hypothetical protein
MIRMALPVAVGKLECATVRQFVKNYHLGRATVASRRVKLRCCASPPPGAILASLGEGLESNSHRQSLAIARSLT